MYLIVSKKKILIHKYTSFYKRLKGFMFQRKRITSGIVFPRCNSIHTFFMFQNIDVIMTNQNNKIIKMYPNLKKGRIILPKKYVYYTYELPLGICKEYQIGDYLKIELEI